MKVENKEDDFLLKKDNVYYLFCDHLPMAADPNVALVQEGEFRDIFSLDKKIKRITWLDNGEKIDFDQKDGKVTVKTVPYTYGRQLVVRVAKIETE